MEHSREFFFLFVTDRIIPFLFPNKESKVDVVLPFFDLACFIMAHKRFFVSDITITSFNPVQMKIQVQII